MKTSPLLLLYLLLSLSTVFAQTERQDQSEQIKWFFPGSHLKKDYQFKFSQKFEEVTLLTQDSASLSALLFKSPSSKGVILYLHGNTGGLDRWGKISNIYTTRLYDVFFLDYRGYGKSTGHIQSESQLFSDVQTAYNYLKTRYQEDEIVVLGYSLGAVPAAWLGAHNSPRAVILQSPCYSLPDAIHVLKPTKDTTSLSLQFNIYQYVRAAKAPVYIFQGEKDRMFYYGSSLKLRKFFKPGDSLFTLPGSGHLGIESNPAYVAGMNYVLNPWSQRSLIDIPPRFHD